MPRRIEGRRRGSLVERRPAEATTGLAGLVVVLLNVLDLAHIKDEVTLLIAAVAVLPAIVTAIVERLRGPA